MAENVQKVEITDDKRSGLATASMVLGIIAIIGSWIPFLNVFSIVLAVVGLGLGVPALIVLIAKKRGSTEKTIAGLVLCILTLMIAVNMNNAVSDAVNDGMDDINNNFNEMTGENTEQILANDLDVTFGNYTTDGNEYFETGKLEVTIKNKTNETYNYSINIEALDKDGVRIATDTIYVDEIAPNQTAKFDTFSYQEVEKLKTAVKYVAYEVSRY